MKCPVCTNKAITFMQWCQGRNALRWQCNSCGAGLRGGKTFWIGLSCTLALTLAVVVIAVREFDFDIGRGNPGRIVLTLMPLVIGTALTYALGGYKPDD